MPLLSCCACLPSRPSMTGEAVRIRIPPSNSGRHSEIQPEFRQRSIANLQQDGPTCLLPSPNTIQAVGCECHCQDCTHEANLRYRDRTMIYQNNKLPKWGAQTRQHCSLVILWASLMNVFFFFFFFFSVPADHQCTPAAEFLACVLDMLLASKLSVLQACNDR